jgi:glycosyltransferase involved in cell wall biosynthesis
MKIGYVISIRTGMDSFVYREVDELIKMGLEIVLFPTKYNKGVYMPKEIWDYYIYHPFLVLIKQPLFFVKSPLHYLKLFYESIKTKSLLDFIIAFDFATQMKKKDVNRIHCHFGDHKLFIGYYCKRILGIPLTVTIHAHELTHNPNWIMFIKSLEACDKIVSISDYNKQILTEKFNIDSNKITVIRLFGFEKTETNRIKILIVGWFHEKKGQDILFNAVKKLNRNDIKVWVVGRKPLWGNEIVDVEKLAKSKGIEDKVIIFGEISDDVLKVLYNSCDLFCLPSKTSRGGTKEGIPVALMEAMSYGKPVISTRHTGIPELVEEILVEENNVEELAKAIELLADNPELRKKLGERNRKIIEEKYSKKNVMKLRDLFIGGR